MALDHYVSQVHLKRFCSPDTGRLFAIRKSDLKRFPPRTEDVCRIDEGSTNEYLTEPRAIEEFLKTVEGRYNSAVSALETGRPDQPAVYAIAGFAAYVMSCSPAAMRINSIPLKGVLEMTAKLMEKSGRLQPPSKDILGEPLAELIEAGRVSFVIDPKYPQAIGIASILQRVATLGNFRWEVLLNEHDDCPFFTSDFPIAIEPTRDPRFLNKIIPLTPTIAVRLQPDIDLPRVAATLEFRHFSFERRKVRRQEAVEINRFLVRSAEDAVFFRAEQSWVAGFVEKNRNFRAETENIQIAQGGGTLQWSRQVIVPYSRSAGAE